MALGLSTAFTTLFDAEVKQAYQAMSVLRGTTRMRVGVEGNTVKFPKIGKGVATHLCSLDTELLRCRRLGLMWCGNQPYAACLAPSTSMDLSLHNTSATQALGNLIRLLWRGSDTSFRNLDTVGGQKLFCLVFM